MESGGGSRPTHHGYIAPEYHAKVAAAISERLDNGQNEVYDIELINREGMRRIVSVRGTVITFEGSPAIMSVLTDITAAKNTERALLESEEKYRSLWKIPMISFILRI